MRSQTRLGILTLGAAMLMLIANSVPDSPADAGELPDSTPSLSQRLPLPAASAAAITAAITAAVQRHSPTVLAASNTAAAADPAGERKGKVTWDGSEDPDHPQAHSRQMKIKEAFEHSWAGYERYAWGKDELMPLSDKANDAWGGFAVTMVDGLDTAIIMGLRNESRRAIEWLDRNLDLNHSHFVSVFEMTIRVLGGLLSAFDLSNDPRLLKLAVSAADRLLAAFGENGLPSAQLNMHTGERRQHNWARGPILAEVGSVQLEFQRLATITGEVKYEQEALCLPYCAPLLCAPVISN